MMDCHAVGQDFSNFTCSCWVIFPEFDKYLSNNFGYITRQRQVTIFTSKQFGSIRLTTPTAERIVNGLIA